MITRSFADGRVVLWHITEDGEELRALLAADDLAIAGAISNSARRRHFMAGRAALRSIEPGLRITYAASGAPQAEGCYISVSHAGDYALAACREVPCGVDVESLERNFERVASRYLSQKERALPGLTLAAAWCAKEAVYKLAGIEGLSLMDDIVIVAAGADCIEARYRLPGGEMSAPFRLAILDIGGYVIAYTV